MSGWMTRAIRGAGAVFVVAALVTACGAGDAETVAEESSKVGGTRHASGAGALLQQQVETGQSSITQSDEIDLLGPPVQPLDSVNIDLLGFDRGVAGAAVRILEFSDFGCGYCRKFHMEILETLDAEYMQKGTVFWKQIPFIMGNWANSVPASLGAECALEQGKFSQMSHAIYERQSDWKRGSVDDAEAVVREIAEHAGVDLERWDSCMATDEVLWRVQAHTQLARQIGVRSTPTFFVVGYTPIQGALPIELFREVLDTVIVLEALNAGG